MWSTFGNLREKVRERATAAAQVAQGVLQAAAEEEDSSVAPTDPTVEETEWDSWNTADQSKNGPSHPENNFTSNLAPPPPPPEDEPLAPQSPPPPPTFAPPVSVRPKKSGRASRYVVAGLPQSTSTTQPSSETTAAPIVPKPFVPTPVISNPMDENTMESSPNEAPDKVVEQEDQVDPPPHAENEEFDHFQNWGNSSDPWPETNSNEVDQDPFATVGGVVSEETHVNSNTENSTIIGANALEGFSLDQGTQQLTNDISATKDENPEISMQNEKAGDAHPISDFQANTEIHHASAISENSVAEFKTTEAIEESNQPVMWGESTLVPNNVNQQGIDQSFAEWGGDDNAWDIPQPPQTATSINNVIDQRTVSNAEVDISNKNEEQPLKDAFGDWNEHDSNWNFPQVNIQQENPETSSTNYQTSQVESSHQPVDLLQNEQQEQLTENSFVDWGTNNKEWQVSQNITDQPKIERKKELSLEQFTVADTTDTFANWNNQDSDWTAAQDKPSQVHQENVTSDNVYTKDQPVAETPADLDWFSENVAPQPQEENSFKDNFLDSDFNNTDQSNAVQDSEDQMLEKSTGSNAVLNQDGYQHVETGHQENVFHEPFIASENTSSKTTIENSFSYTSESQVNQPGSHQLTSGTTSTENAPKHSQFYVNSSVVNEPNTLNTVPTNDTAEDNLARLKDLTNQVQQLINERDNAIKEKDVSLQREEELRGSLLQMKDQISDYQNNFESISEEKLILEREQEKILFEKSIVEKERDSAIERGGHGIREARGIIEAMRNSQDSTEKREAVISDQIQYLRDDINRISEERNALISEAHDLRETLNETESAAIAVREEYEKRLLISEKEKEISILEREKVLEASQLQSDELKRLSANEQTHLESLKESQQRVQELEDYISRNQKDEDAEGLRLESFSSQLEDMKQRTSGIVVERNALFDEKIFLEKEVEKVQSEIDEVNRAFSDAQRENSSIVSERDELKQRCLSMRDQIAEITKRHDQLTAERDHLVRERTASAAQSNSGSEKERTLAQECEQKTKSLVTLQRKLTSATNKIEKLTSQRNLFHRQRDEAGARLRAAGAEFSSLSDKLQAAITARDSLQQNFADVRNERDEVCSELTRLTEDISALKVEKETTNVELRNMSQLKDELQLMKEKNGELQEQLSALQQKLGSVSNELKEQNGRFEVVVREKELAQSQKQTLEQEQERLQKTMNEMQTTKTDATKKLSSLEVELNTLKEKTSMDIGIAKAELEAEKKISEEANDKLASIQTQLDSMRSNAIDIRAVLVSGIQAAKSEVHKVSFEGVDMLSNIEELSSESDADGTGMVNIARVCSDFLSQVCRSNVQLHQSYQSLEEGQEQASQQIETLHALSEELEQTKQRLSIAETQLNDAKQEMEAIVEQRRTTEVQLATAQNDLLGAKEREAELRNHLEMISEEMKAEVERGVQSSAEERSVLMHDVEKARTNLNSIWNMLQRALANEQVDFMSEATEESDHGSELENIPVLALRATASLIAELERKRAQVDDDGQKLALAEAEATRLIDRVELAEHERDALRGTNERLERKATLAHQEGQKQAQDHYEEVIVQLKDELEDTRFESGQASVKATRSEQEASELRALCSKLTSQFNGRTNELDEAEEKLVFLQDQVSTLEEDLREAHERLREHETESEQARQADVNHLAGELDETTKRMKEMERECEILRKANEEAEQRARESEIAAETHRQAEENLQIAIEQLEAEQESAVEQRTIELQKKVEEATAKESAANLKQKVAAEVESKLEIRDEEIKELRAAIGRLADERVELKLELEKSLSRLNHPDAGGQLVDRRVVRQLLVSYFRVGSVRRRDVLDLMSRMLAFSDTDKIAVGLKRRALMDRLGSLVQPPELDDASLPPIGTVSDKWIEYLMKETENDEDEAKEGW